MAKKRTINEIRQTKEYYTGNTRHQDQEAAKQMAEIGKQEQMNPSKYTENDLEQAKEIIINKITKHFHDVIFEMVNDEMSESYLFQSSNYLTEAGYDIFEDEWFEFYHEHHGDILYQVMQNITN